MSSTTLVALPILDGGALLRQRKRYASFRAPAAFVIFKTAPWLPTTLTDESVFFLYFLRNKLERNKSASKMRKIYLLMASGALASKGKEKQLVFAKASKICRWRKKQQKNTFYEKISLVAYNQSERAAFLTWRCGGIKSESLSAQMPSFWHAICIEQRFTKVTQA